MITGPTTGCTTDSQNVAVRFGSEFPFLSDGSFGDGTLTGFSANSLKLICQIVIGDAQPSPTNWKEIDVTNEISGSTINGYLTVSGITGNTFQITSDLYNNASLYDLSDYIDIPTNGQTDILNFGDEYYFYGNLETDIQATIYEMKYKINLSSSEFLVSQNPTWTFGTQSYISEIALMDENKDILVMSKMQSPVLRQGIQQYVIKLDF
jgi:hypothetical protein